MEDDPLKILCAIRMTDGLNHLLDKDAVYYLLNKQNKELMIRLTESKKQKKVFEKWYEVEAQCTAYVCEKSYLLGLHDGVSLYTNLQNK